MIFLVPETDFCRKIHTHLTHAVVPLKFDKPCVLLLYSVQYIFLRSK